MILVAVLKRQSFREHWKVVESHRLVCVFSAKASGWVWLLNSDITSVTLWLLLVAIVEGSQLLNNIDDHFVTSRYKTRQLLSSRRILVTGEATEKRQSEITARVLLLLLLPTWRKEMNLPICICNSPSTMLVSDTVWEMEMLWIQNYKSNKKCQIFLEEGTWLWRTSFSIVQ